MQGMHIDPCSQAESSESADTVLDSSTSTVAPQPALKSATEPELSSEDEPESISEHESLASEPQQSQGPKWHPLARSVTPPAAVQSTAASQSTQQARTSPLIGMLHKPGRQINDCS